MKCVFFFIFLLLFFPSLSLAQWDTNQAYRIITNVEEFDNNLSSDDTDLQKVCDTIDELALGGTVSDTAYSVAWDGETAVAPSKNAVYDTMATYDTLYLKLDCSNDPLTAGLDVAPNTDVASTFGRWKAGYIGGLFTDLAYLSHYDYFDWNKYALMQDNSGNTYLNGFDAVYLVTEGITKARLYPSGGTDDRFHLVTDVALCLGGALGSERVLITQSGTNPTILDIDTPYSNLQLNLNGRFIGEDLTIDSNIVNLSDTTDEYVLAFDTATQTWRGVVSAGAGSSPGGIDTQVQFNDGGSFGGDSGFVYDKNSNTATVDTLEVSTIATIDTLHLTNALADTYVADILTLTNISNLTTNGLVTTSSGDGTLGVDTKVYLVGTDLPNEFQTIAVAGQNNVVADATTDTLTFVAGTNITITTDESADSVTINSSYTETDPNALLTAGTDNVKDTHIDWGSGANQVDLADIPGGTSGAHAWDFGGATSVEVPNGTNPTLTVAGQVSVDTSATQDCMVRFYGDAQYALPAYQSKSFVITNPTSSADGALWRVPYAITIKAIHGVIVGGTSLTGMLTECDINGLNAASVDSVAMVITTSNTEDDGSLSNSSIDAGDYIGWATDGVSGSVTRAVITFEYTINPS